MTDLEIAAQVYDSFEPENVCVRLVGATMKYIIVSPRFNGMGLLQRIETVRPFFKNSSIGNKYLVSYETWTPDEAAPYMDDLFNVDSYDQPESWTV